MRIIAILALIYIAITVVTWAAVKAYDRWVLPGLAEHYYSLTDEDLARMRATGLGPPQEIEEALDTMCSPLILCCLAWPVLAVGFVHGVMLGRGIFK